MVKKITKVKKTAKSKKTSVPEKRERYFEAVGRMKTATARVRLYTKNSEFIINEKKLDKYFPVLRFQKNAFSPLEKMKISDKLGVSVKVKGSGLSAQAGAIRHGISRALVKFNPEFKKRLRKAGYLTRDSRMVERKKPGLKKARRAPQWKKR
ncbi:MAG TPA: 30S ribosomal protein S9 [Candidatus Wolfebacteria bacterium]|nr:30S ribosomal protein S9 [Candidatus Wolfebacteria bacterium]